MELVILLPVIALILVSLMEVGFLMFVRHTLTNASREGARAAVVFYVGEDRAGWAQTQAQTTVNTYLNNINFHRFNTWDVRADVPDGSGWTTGVPVTVTVTTPNGLLLLDDLIPAFQGISVQGVTTMKLE